MKVVLLTLLLTGCATIVPVTQTWPEAPGQLAMEPCPQLQKLPDAAQLSDVAKTITNNYTSYYECAVKLDAWQTWYHQQQLIFKELR
jgi:hypothetical protein